MATKYKILGAEGETITLGGNTYAGGVETIVEISESDAVEALAAGKIEVFDESTEDSTEEQVEGAKTE